MECHILLTKLTSKYVCLLYNLINIYKGIYTTCSLTIHTLLKNVSSKLTVHMLHIA